MFLVPFFGTTPPQNAHPAAQFHPKDYQTINRVAADICGNGRFCPEDYIITLAAGVGDRVYSDTRVKLFADPEAGLPFPTQSSQNMISGGKERNNNDLPSDSVISRLLTLTSVFGYGPRQTPSLRDCYNHFEENNKLAPYLYVTYPAEWHVLLPEKPQLVSAFELRDTITEAAKKYDKNKPNTALNLALAALAYGLQLNQGIVPPKQAMRIAVQTIVSVAQLCPLTPKNKYIADQRLAPKTEAAPA